MEAGAIITLGAGQYRLCERLGGSAYGVVWRAAGAGQEVALKLVNREQMLQAGPSHHARWTDSAFKEIAFLRSLRPWDERHIVRLLDSGEHEGLPVMALELMDGDLARHVGAMRGAACPIPLPQILAWLAQINQALAKVHQYGWRYLDLKPANVLLKADGGAKLADFGTNRLLAERGAAAYAGTASWQAPEQFFPGADGQYITGAATDYFALGAMFFFLVTGGQPLRFCCACGDAYRAHRTGGAAVLLARHGGQLPPTLCDDEAALFAQRIGAGRPEAEPALLLLRALLAPGPGDRPRHALDISRMIAAIAATGAAPARCLASTPMARMAA